MEPNPSGGDLIAGKAKDPEIELRSLPWHEAFKLGVTVTLAWRIGFSALAAAVWLVASPYLPLGPNPSSDLSVSLPWYPSWAGQAILGVWPRWVAILQTKSGPTWVGPIYGIYFVAAQVISKPEFLTWLETASALLFAALLAAMLIRPRWRCGEWLLCSGSNLILFSGVHTLVASAWRSIARFVLVVFSGFIILGNWLVERPRRFGFGYLSISLSLQIIFSSRYIVFRFPG